MQLLYKYKLYRKSYEEKLEDKVHVEHQKYVLIASSAHDLLQDWDQGLHGTDVLVQIFDLFLSHAKERTVQVIFGGVSILPLRNENY